MPVRSFMHRVDDIDWYCQQQGDGPAVVLVPSGEGDCTSFDAVAELLADQFMVLTFDMPGFSRTSAPVDKISMFKAADQIAALVRSLNIDTATFYGCSSGGIIVLSLIVGQTDLVTNGIVHEVAFGADYRDDKFEPLLPGRLPALADDEVVEQCKMIFREYMNEDQASWDALGEEYHAWAGAELPDLGAPVLLRRPRSSDRAEGLHQAPGGLDDRRAHPGHGVLQQRAAGHKPGDLCRPPAVQALPAGERSQGVGRPHPQ